MSQLFRESISNTWNGCQLIVFHGCPAVQTWIHGRSATEDNVAVELAPNVDVATGNLDNGSVTGTAYN